jgi:hypothetical protein
LPTLRHVAEYTPPDALHPVQGLSAVLKLDWQPPMQLPVSRWSLASFELSDIGDVEAVAAAGAVRIDLVLWTVA